MDDEVERSWSLGLVLRVDREHCAETAARREYARLAEEYLRDTGRFEDSEYEYRIELLKEFLERTDFAALRSQCERMLRDAGELYLTLFRDGEGILAFVVEPSKDIP